MAKGYTNFNEYDISQLSKIISGTPWWVWVLFIYLLRIYIKSLANHTVYIYKFYIFPIIFIVAITLRCYNIYGSPYLSYYLIYSFIGLTIGVLIGFSSSLPPLKISTDINSVDIQGTVVPLIVFLVFFTVRYIFGFLQSSNPTIVGQYSYIENIITGAFFGYNIGRSSYYILKFKNISLE